MTNMSKTVEDFTAKELTDVMTLFDKLDELTNGGTTIQFGNYRGLANWLLLFERAAEECGFGE